MGERKSETPRLDAISFLKNLSQLYPINRIYYPGAWTDDFLEQVFQREQIYYLEAEYDNDAKKFATSRKSLLKRKSSRNYLVADYGKSPFKNEVFDAIFFRDNHADEKEFEEMLKTLKVGGLVIVGFTCFGDLDKIDILRTPNLKRLKLPFRHDADADDRFVVLKKTEKQLASRSGNLRRPRRNKWPF